MPEDQHQIRATGGCLCGAVRYEVRGPLRPVVYCHCTQCRRTSGHFSASRRRVHSTSFWASRRGYAGTDHPRWLGASSVGIADRACSGSRPLAIGFPLRPARWTRRRGSMRRPTCLLGILGTITRLAMACPRGRMAITGQRSRPIDRKFWGGEAQQEGLIHRRA
jgi:hypothetical protein